MGGFDEISRASTYRPEGNLSLTVGTVCQHGIMPPPPPLLLLLMPLTARPARSARRRVAALPCPALALALVPMMMNFQLAEAGKKDRSRKGRDFHLAAFGAEHSL